MARDKRARGRSVRPPRRWRNVAGWSAGLLGAVIVLGATGYLVGRAKPANPTGVVETLAAVAGLPAVALAIACAALLHAAWCVRHLILHWLAWRPGAIEVTIFTAATPITDANAEQLTLVFRQRLMALHLQSPTPVPGAAAEGDFLDVLGRNGLDARNPLATLIGLLRAAKPTHAYEVRGVFMERAEIPRYGVAGVGGGGGVEGGGGDPALGRGGGGARVAVGRPPAGAGLGRDVGHRAAQGGRRGDRADPPADAPVPRALGGLAWLRHAARPAARVRGGCPSGT